MHLVAAAYRNFANAFIAQVFTWKFEINIEIYADGFTSASLVSAQPVIAVLDEEINSLIAPGPAQNEYRVTIYLATQVRKTRGRCACCCVSRSRHSTSPGSKCVSPARTIRLHLAIPRSLLARELMPT